LGQGQSKYVMGYVKLLTSFTFYGRTLSDASMLYFADVFFNLFFYARLSWRNG